MALAIEISKLFNVSLIIMGMVEFSLFIFFFHLCLSLLGSSFLAFLKVYDLGKVDTLNTDLQNCGIF